MVDKARLQAADAVAREPELTAHRAPRTRAGGLGVAHGASFGAVARGEEAPGDVKQVAPEGQSLELEQASPILACELPVATHSSSQVLQTVPALQSRSLRQPTTHTPPLSDMPPLEEKIVWPLQIVPAGTAAGVERVACDHTARGTFRQGGAHRVPAAADGLALIVGSARHRHRRPRHRESREARLRPAPGHQSIPTRSPDRSRCRPRTLGPHHSAVRPRNDIVEDLDAAIELGPSEGVQHRVYVPEAAADPARDQREEAGRERGSDRRPLEPGRARRATGRRTARPELRRSGGREVGHAPRPAPSNSPLW